MHRQLSSLFVCPLFKLCECVRVGTRVEASRGCILLVYGFFFCLLFCIRFLAPSSTYCTRFSLRHCSWRGFDSLLLASYFLLTVRCICWDFYEYSSALSVSHWVGTTATLCTVKTHKKVNPRYCTCQLSV